MSYNKFAKEAKYTCAGDVFVEGETCCFSGHRPKSLPWGTNEKDSRCLELKLEIAGRLEGIYASGFRRFLCGMALGCDSYFAEAVMALRAIHPDVSLEAIIPCGTQPDRWTQEQRKRYNKLIDSCDCVKVLQYNYSPQCMMRRNEYMVDNSSLLLSCFNGRPSGTMKTILYAKRQGLRVIVIDI